jgi:hypothetical protein
MPSPSSLACTAAAPATGRKGRGNPNLHLAPRCGARTRAGCPCRAPAIRGKQRCRMHGGRSTGPRTAEGLARLRAARTVHGRYTPQWRAHDRRVLTTVRRNRVYLAVLRYLERLPPELVNRFRQRPPELQLPPYATGACLTVAQDREIQRAEKEALAPWKQALASARLAGKLGKFSPTAPAKQQCDAQPRPHAPVPARPDLALPQNPAGNAPATAAPKPHAPENPTAPRTAPTRPYATEPPAAKRSTTTTTQPGHDTPATAASKPHAPENPTALRAAPTRPHAPEPPAGVTTTPPPGRNALAPALTEPHAPEPAPINATPPSLGNRAARRWQRRLERLRQKRTGPRA